MIQTLPSQPDRKMKSNFIFFLLFIQCSFMSAQTININTVEVCAGQEVLLPVTAVSVSNVGALTLYISFDTTTLAFISVENLNPQLDGMSVNMMTNPLQLACAWSSTTPINLLNDKIFDLKFISNEQSSPVFYNPGCEIADPAGVVIPVVYTNGAVNSGLPVILTQPKDTLMTEGGQATFSVFSPNASSFTWMEFQNHGTSWHALPDSGIYSGTHTQELSIFPVPLSFDNNKYQCVLLNNDCQAISETATLSVDALAATENFPTPDHKDLIVSPVPFNNNTNIEFTLHENCNVMIQVMNCMGQLVSEINLPSQQTGHHHILLNTIEWHSGIYFLKFTGTFSNEQINRVVKIIKSK
ncbi:MAG: T9SS type A sorting domain-containing protein [Bacteroidetes bacterium]|nr:T9SS type A sorting domain-containing protein [Bacteroidota bacterium]